MPSTLLLAVHCKKSDAIDIKTPVVKYVASTYGAQAVEEAGEDMQELQDLRNDIVNLAGALPDLRRAMAKYLRLLDLLSSRVPIGRGPEDVRIQFAWADAFRSTKRSEQASLEFERAAVLFNLGAVLSQMALACDRSTEAGLRDSARLFQESAGYFSCLREGLALRLERPAPVDLSPEGCDMLCSLMLAQAQECAYEKAAADGKSAALLARLAKQTATHYDDCARLLGSPPLSSHFDKSWPAHAVVKAALAGAEAAVQSAAAMAAADPLVGVAREIARLRVAQVILSTAKKEARGASKELQESVAFQEAAIAKRLARAERENATVYLQRVPSDADLPGIVPASIAKPTPPGDLDPVDDEARTHFTSVVPDACARALSRYTSQVDGVIRSATERLDAASDEARLRLREWELPDALQALDPGSAAALPDAVRAELEDVERAGGVQHLHEISAQVKDVRRVAVEELTALERDLDAEETDDEALRAHYGTRWARAPSAQLTRSLRDRIAGYRANLGVAADSDARLEQRLAAEAAGFAALDVQAAAAEMPRLQAPMLSVDDMGPATTISTLRSALEGLATLSAQRASLEEGLKERKRSDNILPKLLASPRSPEELFKQELAKYDDLVAEVEANATKQAQLLAVVRTAQARFKEDHGYEDWRRACQTAAAGIRSQCSRFKEMQDNLAEGLRFYMSLQEAVEQLKQHAGDHVLTRRMQRDEMVDDLRKRSEAEWLSTQMSTLQVSPPPPPPQAQQQQQAVGRPAYDAHQYPAYSQQQQQYPAYSQRQQQYPGTQAGPYPVAPSQQHYGHQGYSSAPPPQAQQQQAAQASSWAHAPAPPPPQQHYGYGAPSSYGQYGSQSSTSRPPPPPPQPQQPPTTAQSAGNYFTDLLR